MDIEFENHLRAIGADMDYPQTPEIAEFVDARIRISTHPRFVSKKFAWSLTIVLVLLSSLSLIPTARAAIIDFIQIGIVRIFPQVVETPPINAHITATPDAPVPSIIQLLDNILGETNLVNAKRIVSYPLLLPTYPEDLGQPNHVYIQDVDGTMTILVWVDPLVSQHVTMSLHFIPTGSWAINKMAPVVIEEAVVNGQRAIWAEGPYPLIVRNGEPQFTRLIEGYVLIWEDRGITYRLETNVNLEEAIKIAESLAPIP